VTRTEPRRRRRWVGLPRHDYDDDGTCVDPLRPQGQRGRCTHCSLPSGHEIHRPAPQPRRPRSSVDLAEVSREYARRIGERDEEVA
jgi:hypothetical protein